MKKNKKLFKYLFITVAIFLSALFFIFLYWQNSYYSKTYPGTTVGEVDMNKKSKEEVNNIIKEYVYRIEKNGLTFEKNDNVSVLKIGSDSFDSGPTYPFLNVDLEESTSNFFDKYDNKSFWLFIKNLISNKNNDKDYIEFELEEKMVKSFLEESYPILIIPYENAYFYLSDNEELKIYREKIGKDIDYNNVYKQINENIHKLENDKINLSTHSVYPEFKKEDLKSIEYKIVNILEKAKSMKLVFKENSDNDSENDLEDKKWSIPAKTLISWIGVRDNTEDKIFLDEEKIRTYLEEEIAEEVKVEMVLPKFEVEEEKVKNWQVGENGRELDIDESIENIKDGFKEDKTEIFLSTNILDVESFTSKNDFNIEEIIGTGHSNFSGSSASRIENIRVGSEFLNGLLIKPGEEFSLMSNLGEIDAENGYKPELVIKDGETIPEYGGGLCQVGTTMFRTALQTGLPITERRNHSYRVSYYEPAGTDATIYDPWPDFKFANDTGNYILIQYRMEGNNLYYDFWGVNDGREVTVNDPVIYNIVKPPDTKIVETEDLEPGEKKCTESAHNGADAYFDYKVVYPENSTTTPIKERRFSSHYVPWQAVCLVGKENTEEDETINEETNKEEGIDKILKDNEDLSGN
ncbi:MAG: VanW family protein [Patescibacteria group bacterium]|jgi:vancomycin resistance protein YoaR|nr:VanW family protein [Patescibacteria group bacterium]